MSNKTKLIVYLAAVYVIWGSTYLGMKIATQGMPPFLISTWRFVCAGSILLLIGILKEKQWPDRQQILSAAGVGALLIGVGNGGTALAVHYMPSGLVALIVAAMPAWFVGLDWLFFSKQRPTNMTIWGILIGFTGLFILFNPFAHHDTRDYPLWPIAVVVTGSICWATGSLMVQRLRMPTQMISTAIQMLSGAIVSILASLLFERSDWHGTDLMTPATWTAFVYLVAIGSLVGFTSYSWLARNAPPRLVSTYAYVNPVVALFLGWAIADEALTGIAVLASAIVVCGVVLMTMGRRLN